MRKMPGGVEIKNTLKIFILTMVSVAALDQLTKYVIMAALHPHQAIEVLPFFNIVYYRNPGAAFGIFNDGGALRTLFLIGTSTVALIVIAVLLRQSKDPVLSFALSLIAGGAAGNLIDRVRFGSVIDFLDFYVSSYHWPAFNVADSAITAGVVLAVFSFYSDPKE